MSKLISVRLEDEPELYAKVQKQASENERALSRQVIFILKQYFKALEERTEDTPSQKTV